MKRQIILMSKYFIVFFSFFLAVGGVNETKVSAFSNQVIQKGAVGNDVIELQSRLQYIGYYNGKIDGVFGWSTYWALRNFQYEYGLPIDGLAGWETKLKLAKASKYNEQFVKNQIEKGGKFTHYGGVDLNKQKPAGESKSAPTKKQPDVPSTHEKAPVPSNPNPAQTKNTPPGQPVTPKATEPKPAQPTAPKATEPKSAQPAAPKATQPKPTQPAVPKATEPKPAQPAPQQQKEQPKKPTAANTPNGFSQNDIQLMANAVYGESRGEPYTGQVAVAAVILNRVESANFPDTVSGVIFEPGAFTAVADGQIWLTPNELAKKAVLDALNGMDPTGNAIYYFNPATATNKWIWSRPQIKRIGKHIFCK